MKQTQTTFNSSAKVVGVTDKASTQDDSFAGLSHLPRSQVEQIHKEKNLSPRSIKKRVHAFVDDKVVNSKQATAVMFEELSQNTSKIHRHALHSKLDSLEGHEVRLRGQTAGVGIRLNPKLANQRGTLASQGRRAHGSGPKGGLNSSYYVPTEEEELDPSQFNVMNKTGGLAYPGQPLQVSTASMLGQTLNKFELGEVNTSKLKTISGVQYYKQHIHLNQQNRLRKYIKNPAGHAPNSKRFIPLTDVAKPSLQGRVKMYMQRLTEEEQREKQKLNKKGGDEMMRTTGIENFSSQRKTEGQKSQSMLGSAEGATSPKRETDNFFAARKGLQSSPFNGNRDSYGTAPQQAGRPRMTSMKQPSSGSHNMSQGKLTTNPKRRMTEQQNIPIIKKDRVGVSQHVGRKGSFADIEEETELSRHDEFASATSTKKAGGNRKKKVEIVADERSATMSKSFGKGTTALQNKLKAVTAMGLFGSTNKDKSMKVGGLPMDDTTGKRADKLKRQTTQDSAFSDECGNAPAIIFRKLRAFSVTIPQDRQNSGSNLPVEEHAAKLFIEMTNFSENKDYQNAIRQFKNARINRPKLVNYLKKRYTTRIVQKIVSIFDWSNGTLDANDFYTRLNDFLLHPKEITDPVAHLRVFKRFAFQLFDMNCDQNVCETDIFTFIESHKEDNDFFSKSLIYDLQDISAVFKQRNSVLSANDAVMENQEPDNPKIKSLEKFLDQTKVRKQQRKEIKEQEVFTSSLFQVPVVADKSKKGDSIDNNDLYAGMGAAYKQQFRKMIGATGDGSKKLLIEKDSEKNKAQKRDLTETGLREMRSQGLVQFTTEHKKKPMLSFFIHKMDEIYEKHSVKAFLSEDDFVEKVNFRFGLPLIVLDFIDIITGSDFIETVKKNFVDPPKHIQRFDPQNDEFQALKGEVEEAYIPYIFGIFNALGVIDLAEIGKQAGQAQYESIQYLTLQSIQKNLPKVFGIKNNFFGEMLFCFISNHAPLTHRITYHQFFASLKVFWPKREIIPDYEDQASREWRLRNAQQNRKSEMRKFMYQFIRLSGGRMITILDLVKLCCFFDKDSCNFGKECEELMKYYKAINIEPRYVHQRQEFGYQQYLKYVPYSCLIQDLEFAFFGQIKLMLQKHEYDRDDTKLVTFPLQKWKMLSIFNEEAGQRQFKEQKEELKMGKLLEDKDKDRKMEFHIERVDIERIDELKNILNQD